MWGMTPLDWTILVALVLLASGAYAYFVLPKEPEPHGLGFFDDGYSEAEQERRDANRRASDLRGFAACLFWPGLFLLIMAGGIIPLAHTAIEKECRDTAQDMDRDYSWSSWTGCLIVTDDGELVPEDRLRFNESGEVVESDN